MDNLSYYQKRVLDKLLPSLEKTDSFEELNRICKLYRESIEKEQDPYIIQVFKTGVESNLHRLLQSKSEFYNFGYFEDQYKELSSDFVEENIDADECDFIEEYINSQQEIIDKTFKYFIKVEGYEQLEVTQFVSNGFFEDFIRGSKKKIEFLENRLCVLNASISEVTEVNPYPLIFTSANIYLKFNEYTSKHIIDYYLDYSYLKKRLEHENLIHRVKDNDFMHLIYSKMSLLTEKQYNDYCIINGLSSLNKSSSNNRENNFNNIFTVKVIAENRHF